MSFVVEGVVLRARARYGLVRASGWQVFADYLRLKVFIAPLPAGFDAIIHDDTILIRHGISATEAAYAVWHEIGHSMLHAGDWRWWLTRPQGYITVARFERQADEFAATFPIWDEQAALFWPN